MKNKKQKQNKLTEEQLIEYLAILIFDAFILSKKSNNKQVKK
jgi:hypothetical protein